MTTYYVDSAAGSNTAPYDTWAKAATTLATIAAIDAAGDTIYVANTHAESTAAAVSWGWVGTLASPTRIICADKTSGAPPATLSTAGAVSTSGANSQLTISATGGAAAIYWYGLTFTSGVGDTGNSGIISQSTSQLGNVENCNFVVATTSATQGNISLASSAQSRVVAKNCTFKFANAGQTVSTGSEITINGGSLAAGGTSPTVMFTSSSAGLMWIDGFDFSNASAGINLVAGTGKLNAKLRNCKLPAAWSGALTTSTLIQGARIELNNTDSTGSNYRVIIMDAFGQLDSETTLVRTGGANDGVTGLSWKIVTTANAKYDLPFLCTEVCEWNSLTGSPVTATIEILHDSATKLKDSEVWIEVEYLASSAAPLGSFINDSSGSILASGADQTASSSTWTTTGMSNPNKQKLSVTFTPQMAGVVHAVVKVAKASYTLYVDPKLTIS